MSYTIMQQTGKWLPKKLTGMMEVYKFVKKLNDSDEK